MQHILHLHPTLYMHLAADPAPECHAYAHVQSNAEFKDTVCSLLLSQNHVYRMPSMA